MPNKRIGRSYLNEKEKTIIGFYNHRENAIRDFRKVVTENTNSGSFKETACSDWYYKSTNLKNIYGHYFGFYAVPKWVFKLIDEMNEFFEYWNIQPVAVEKFYIVDVDFAGRRKIHKLLADEYQIKGDYCWALLFQVIPEKKITKRTQFENWFNIIQLYMHHIFRVVSLHHKNSIDNNFIPKNRFKNSKYPHLEYVLYKSFHTWHRGYNLFDRGCVTLEALNNLNDITRINKLMKETTKTNSNYKYRWGSKTLQSSLLEGLAYTRKFKIGQRVYVPDYFPGWAYYSDDIRYYINRRSTFNKYKLDVYVKRFDRETQYVETIQITASRIYTKEEVNA